MLLDKFPQDGHKGNQSWLRGSVLKLKRCIPNIRHGAKFEERAARGTKDSSRSRSPSRKRPISEASEPSSRSSFSQDVHRLSTRGPSPLDLSSEYIHEHTGFRRKDPILEERRSIRKAKDFTASSCGDSKAASVAEIINDRLQACSAVRTPRVPGDEVWRGRTSQDEEEVGSVSDTLNKEGLSMKVPNYLTKLTGASRDGVRAVPQLRPVSDVRKKHGYGTCKSKSGTLASVTVPISAKQWLLQAIGLKDTEIREMFDQMESLPQLAAEYVREVRAEWEAMEARVNKVPLEADFLVKDRALLEKVRELIVRFIESTNHIEADVSVTPEDADLVGNVDEEVDKMLHGSKNALDLDDTNDAKEVCKDAQSVDSVPCGLHSEAELPSSAKPICSCGQFKDIQTDQGASHPETHNHILPSFIPVEDYVINKYVVQPELLGKSDCKSTYSPCDKRWYTVVFPALQPGKREDAQLLGDWLQHAMQKNHCEKTDGRFEDVESAFLLHCIAFLEIVRQVDIHCEERGNLLLHLWRQLLRIFNQVMVRAEPKLNATEEEMKRLRDDLEMTRDQFSKLVTDHDFYKSQYDVIREKLQVKEKQLTRIKRCRLCCTENMTPRSREEYLEKLKRRSISFRYTPSADFTAPLSEEELKRQEELKKQEELKRQEEELKRQEEELKRQEEAAGTAVEGETGESMGPSAEELIEEDRGVETVLGFKDEFVQTDDSKGLRRCQSAPPNIFPQTRVADGQGKEGKQGETISDEPKEAKATEVSAPQLTSEDLKDLAGGWVDPDHASKKEEVKEGAGDERLKEFETLAVDTIGLLDRLPMEGALAEKIELLLKKYCDLTGTVLGEKAREKLMQDTKSILRGKRGSVAEGSKVSFMEGKGSELRKSRKSKGSKWGLQLKSYVPLGFAKMMKIYNPPKNVKFFNVRQLTKLISSVYVNKIVADAVDDSCNNERQTCCEFVYDFMLNQYGLKGLSESAIFGVFKTIKTLLANREIEKYHKIRLFSRFVGMDESNSYSEPELYLYLKLLQKASSKQGVLLPSDQDDGLCFLNASQYAYIADESNLVSYFGSQGAAVSFIEKYVAKNAVTERASPEIRKIVKESEVRKLDWDLLVEAILAVYPHKMDTIHEERRKSIQVSKPVPKEKATELENLFIAGDANQDGVLTFSEFREIVTTADPSLSVQSALRMFRETLLMMPDGGDNISPQAFAQIAYNHGIEAPASVVFDLLKKTWAQVQNDIDQEKVNANKDDYDFSKEVLLDLMHQKVDVNSAVQTFRQLVLRFCSTEEEEEPPSVDDEEEQPIPEEGEAEPKEDIAENLEAIVE